MCTRGLPRSPNPLHVDTQNSALRYIPRTTRPTHTFLAKNYDDARTKVTESTGNVNEIDMKKPGNLLGHFQHYRKIVRAPPNRQTAVLKTTKSLSVSRELTKMRPAKDTLELLRDILKLYGNFIRELAEIEQLHDFNFSELQNVFGGPDSTDFYSSLMQQDPKMQLAFISTFGKFALLSKDFQNAMAFRATEKMSFAEKLDEIVAGLESATGASTITTQPTDIDRQLIERCAHKDYHDTVTNAFPLLEDRMRSKLDVGREYSGDQLVNLAFNPDSGRLSLGTTSPEKQGIYLLFKGAFSFLRNPPSHTLGVDEGRNAALKIITLIDLLIKLVDKADFVPSPQKQAK